MSTSSPGPGLSDRLLNRINALEAWLEATRSRRTLLPLRLGGYAVLVVVMMVGNLMALVRWPVSTLLTALRPADEPPADDEMPGVPVDVDAEALQALVDSGRTVLVDFWAAWCGPCIMMGESLNRLAADEHSACVVAKVDTVRHADVAREHGVRGLPTLILFVDGHEAARHAGALSYAELRRFVERHVGEPAT